MESANSRASDESIEVRVLGGFGVRSRTGDLDSLPPQASSLLAYLVLHRDRTQTRDLLAGRFWSDLPEDRARRRLSNCLWQIRSAAVEAGLPDLFVSTSSAVKVNPDVRFDVDVEELERGLDEVERNLRDRRPGDRLLERLAGVVELYTGDLLAGHYHDWIDQERERIQARYQAAVSTLVDLCKGRSDYERALGYARTLVALSPLSEECHQEVMRIYALLGQTNAAERQFEICRQVLESELRVEPSSATLELLQRIRSDAPRAPGRPVRHHQPAAIVGRHRELSVLIGRAEELLRGRGGVVLLEGDPGIGKTHLLDEFASGAEWRSVRVMRVGHSELSRMSPYDSLRELLSEATVGLRGEHLAEVLEPVWLHHAAEVLPNLTQFLPDARLNSPTLKLAEESSRTAEALVRTVLAQGNLGPTVIMLDDVHWSDDDTMDVLVSAGTRLAASGVLLCISYRRFEAAQAEQVWSGITALESLPDTTRLVLGPLSAAEVHELAASRLEPGELPALDSSRLNELTGGNPLYVVEALRDPSILIDEEPRAGEGEIGLLSLPDAVASSLRARLGALSAESRRVLDALSVLAEGASVGLVASVADMARRPVVEALTRMADQGLIEEVDQACSFAHEQTRQVVYSLMDDDGRRAFHSRVFDVLVADATDRPDRLGHHARLASRMDDAHVWFLAAGRQALAVNGYRTAADHFGQADQAAREAGRDLRDRAGNLLAYEEVLDVLGRRDEQAMYLKMLREIDLEPELRQELVRREVLLLVNTEDLDKAVRVGEEALAEAERQGLPTHGLLTALAEARRHRGDLPAVIELARRALDVAPDLASQVAAETILGKALVDQAEYPAGSAHLRRAIEGADRLGAVRAKVEALGYLASAQSNANLADESQSNFELALSLSREIGFRWGEGANLLNLAVVNTWRGRGGVALGLYDEARAALGSVGDPRGEAFINFNQAMLSLWLLGDTAAATERANSAAVFFRSVGHEQNECLSLCVLAAADLERGKRRLAARRVRDLLSRAQRSGFGLAEVQARRVQAQLHEAVDDPESALEELQKVIELCDRLGLGTQVPFLAAQAANRALDVGRRSLAQTLVERAVDKRMEGAELAHLATWMCATVLGKLGRRDEATAHVRVAYELLDRNLEGLPTELAHRGRTNVAAHRGIINDYERRFEIQRSALLPNAGAPTGRPLRADELMLVPLTVNHPEDWKATTDTGRRHRRIRRIVAQAAGSGASVRVVDLASALEVSDRTIKRDLAELRANGEQIATRRGS